MKKLVITSEIKNISEVENFIDILVPFYKIPDRVYGKVNLAVVEAVNNAILHGNKCDPHKKVIITFEKISRYFVLTVEDEGNGFDCTNLPDPTDLSNLNKESGRGLYVMMQLTDLISFQKNGAKVVMSFKVQEEQKSVIEQLKFFLLRLFRFGQN